MEIEDAKGNEGASDVRGDQAGRGIEGEGGADRAGKNGNGSGDRKAPKIPTKIQNWKIETTDDLVPLQGKLVRKALRNSDGNIVGAAQQLRMTVSHLDYQLSIRKDLSKFLENLRKVRLKLPEEHQKNAQHRLSIVKKDIEARAILYRSEALDALYELAVMPITDNSALAQVKFLAAQKLYSETGDSTMANAMDDTLRILNERFQEAAPRIKSIRERTVTFEDDGPRVIDATRSETG